MDASDHETVGQIVHRIPKVLENRLRRMAKRQGLKVCKSRTRDPHALDYGLYHIRDPSRNWVIAGGHPYDYSMTIQDVEDYLSADKGTRDATWRDFRDAGWRDFRDAIRVDELEVTPKDLASV